MKTVSTTTLAKELGIESKDLFEKLISLDLIYRKNDKWNLTERLENELGAKKNAERKRAKRNLQTNNC